MRAHYTLLLLLPILAKSEEPCMFRGNAAHTGVAGEASVPTLGSLKWKFHTQGPIFSSPVLCDGVAYVGSADHFLYAIDAASGALKWKFKTQGPVNSSPAIAHGLVYVLSLDGTFYAVDSTSGKAAWRFQTAGERRFSAPGIHGMMPRTEVMPDPFDVFLSSAVVTADLVYFGSGDGAVYALNAASGALRWKFQTGNVVHTSPALSDGLVFVGSFDRNLYALDAQSGALQWKFTTGDDTTIYNQVGIASSPAVAHGTVYFGSRDSHLYALNAQTGEKKWAYDNHGGWVIASPAIFGNDVLFPTSDGQLFLAVNSDSGQKRFAAANKAISFSSPMVAGLMAFYGTSDGLLNAVELRTGKLEASFATDGRRQNSRKYLGPDGKIDDYALYSDVTLDATMVGLSRMYSLGSVLSSPAISGGVAFFGSTDGNLYAVN